MQFELNDDEALVLFEWLKTRDEAVATFGEAEQRVFWKLEAFLERALVEPFESNYATLLEQARKRILAG